MEKPKCDFTGELVKAEFEVEFKAGPALEPGAKNTWCHAAQPSVRLEHFATRSVWRVGVAIDSGH